MTIRILRELLYKRKSTIAKQLYICADYHRIVDYLNNWRIAKEKLLRFPFLDVLLIELKEYFRYLNYVKIKHIIRMEMLFKIFHFNKLRIFSNFPLFLL